MDPEVMSEKERRQEFDLLVNLKKQKCLQAGDEIFEDTLIAFEDMFEDKSLGSSTRIALLTKFAKQFDKAEFLFREGGDNSKAVLVATKKAESVALRAKLEKMTYNLHIAAMKGKIEKVERCIEKYKIAVNARDRFGQTALHYGAAGHKEVTMARLLIEEFGADVNAADLLGITPLHLAASTQRYLICQYLVTQGASLEEPDKMGSTPLHLAASSGSSKTCAVLLAANADVNAMNHRGYTPMHSACRAGRFDVGSLLIDSGADLNATDENGCTPEEVATGCALELFGHHVEKQKSRFARLGSMFRGHVGSRGHDLPATIKEEEETKRGTSASLLGNHGIIPAQRSHPMAAPHFESDSGAGVLGAC